MQFTRSFLFILGYALSAVVWGSISCVIGWFFPYRLRFWIVIVLWVKSVLWWLKVTCNVRIRVQGMENIPKAPCVVLCNHQSTLETLFLQSIIMPITTVIKRRLLYIPFFGWAYFLLNPISIRRDNPRAALQEVMKQGKKRLESGVSVLIFPEGTRLQASELSPFYRSGSGLALAAEVPVLPVVHNSATVWPGGRFLKYPGEVQFSFGSPISSKGHTSKSLIEEARIWMNAEFKKLTQ